MKLVIKIAIVFLVLCTFCDSVSNTVSLFDLSQNLSRNDFQDDEKEKKEEKEEKTEKESSEEEKGEEEEFFKSKNTPEYASLDIYMHFYNLGLILEPHNRVNIPIHPSYQKDTPPPKSIA